MQRVSKGVAGSEHSLPASLVKQGLPLDLVFHAKTFSFDDHGLGVMEQPIQDGGGQGTVMVEDRGPILEGAVRGNHDRPLFVPQTDDLEEQISSSLINGEIAQLVKDEQRGFGVFFQFLFETA